MINIGLALKEAVLALGNHPDALTEAEILLGFVLQKNRAYLMAHPENELLSKQIESFQYLIAKRIQGLPIAYLIGYRDFWTLRLKVNPYTLIPRPETETLVELALQLLPKDRQAQQVLDLGTGSGAIALALAKERPDWEISACDLSSEALMIAEENAKINNIDNVCFYLSNWFDALPQKQYHAILANPPYIASSDPHLIQGDLRFEPLNALVSSQEGLADLQYIITLSTTKLFSGGLLLLEHGYDQKIPIQAIMNELGYKKIQTWQDLQGHDRVTGGWMF